MVVVWCNGFLVIIIPTPVWVFDFDFDWGVAISTIIFHNLKPAPKDLVDK